MATRTRRDAWKLSRVNVWEPTFLWYARAVREMDKRPLNDPTSLKYQAAIHGHDLSRPDGPPDKKTYWNQCQHHCWFFLPWHRWYLLYFEDIVARTVVKLRGPAGWSLPYWNYSDPANPDARKIPPAFIARQMPDGTPNPLRVEGRSGNTGAAVGSPGSVSLTCLQEPRYPADGPQAGRAGFGGLKVKTSNHSGGRIGSVEGTPHNTIHGAVGGFMGSFETAGLDPLFWLHHANIDRLWDVWLADPRHVNPMTDRDWLDLSFPFHDGSGAPVKKTSRGVVKSAALGYVYEDIANPFVRLESVEAEAVQQEAPMPERIPEMIGASDRPVRLSNTPTTTQVPLTEATGPAILESVGAAGVDEEAPRIVVNMENITGDGPAKNFAVYVNGTFAGILPTFGVAEATNESENHPGGGLHFTFDVTDIVNQLGADPKNLDVTFQPEKTEAEEPEEGEVALESVEPEPNFQVGRVSVYIA